MKDVKLIEQDKPKTNKKNIKVTEKEVQEAYEAISNL